MPHNGPSVPFADAHLRTKAAAWAHDQISDLVVVVDYPDSYDYGWNAAIREVLEVFEKIETAAPGSKTDRDPTQ